MRKMIKHQKEKIKILGAENSDKNNELCFSLRGP